MGSPLSAARTFASQPPISGVHPISRSEPTAAAARLDQKLKRLFGAGREHTILTLTGSSTSAVEASLASCVARGQRLLFIDNGAFGARLGEVAAVLGVAVRRLGYAWGVIARAEDVARILTVDPSIAAVAMVHHETSVGLLNPVAEIGAVCREHGRLLIVDAVSSLGGESLDVTRDAVDICFSSASKSLHGVGGASFVCVHDRAWARMERVRPRVYYLDLKRYRAHQHASAEAPFAPGPGACADIDAALDELLAEGIDERRERYQRWNHEIRSGLEALGCEPFTRTGRESCVVITARLPDGVCFDDLEMLLRSRGFLIYNAKDELQDRYFQVATVGALSDAIVARFLEAFAEVRRILTPPVQRRVRPSVAPPPRRTA